MAHRRVQIDRLHRIPAGHVDAVEVLGELEQIPVALAIADPPPAVEVRAVRRARHVDEDHVAPADGDCPLGVSRGDGEMRGREPHLLHHEPAVHAHVGAARVRLAARRLQDLAGLLVQELDPDPLEHPHRPVVHRLHLLGGERLGRGVAVDGDLPRKLPDRRSLAPEIGTAPPGPARAPAGSTVFRFHCSSLCPEQTCAQSRVRTCDADRTRMIGVTIQYILWTVDCLQAIHFSYESYYVTTEIHALFPYVAMNEGAGRESSLRQPRRGRRGGMSASAPRRRRLDGRGAVREVRAHVRVHTTS